MRLFHVSEESNIEVFVPRIPTRDDLDKSVGLVWAIDENHLPNFLTPRNCPRVGFLVNETTTLEDKNRYLKDTKHVVYIEKGWLTKLRETVLYLYEFDPTDFVLQDKSAGYYVSTKTVTPVQKIAVTDLEAELKKRETELRLVDYLQPIGKEIQSTSFDWSLCRMGYARKKAE